MGSMGRLLGITLLSYYLLHFHVMFSLFSSFLHYIPVLLCSFSFPGSLSLPSSLFGFLSVALPALSLQKLSAFFCPTISIHPLHGISSELFASFEKGFIK